MKRVLCAWFPEWPIQRLVAARPELRGCPETGTGSRILCVRAERKPTLPVVLYETCRGVRRVAACSSQARAMGIAAGMPLAEATALAAQSSPAALRPGSAGRGAARLFCLEPCDPAGDREALEALARGCLRFSPVAGVEEAAAPESLFLDVTGLEHLFGGEAALADEVQRHLAQQGLAARVSIADALGAAWAVAHFGQGESPAIVPPGCSPAALRPLPIESLRLTGQVAALLRSLGLYQIGQLEPLCRAELTARFGPDLVRRWDQALGRLAEPVPAQQAPPELEARQSLEHPTTSRETIEAIFERLLGRVAEMLIRAGRGALRVQCRLECQPAGAVELSLGLFEATVSARHLFELVRVQLERLSLPSPVLGASVAVAEAAPFQRRQGELFPEGPARQRTGLLAALIDRLSNRLGRGSVLRAWLAAEAQPELAYRYDPLVTGKTSPLSQAGEGPGVRARKTSPLSQAGEGPGVRAKSTSSRPLLADGTEILPRPLRLVSPVPVASVAVLPDGPPLRFRWKGEEHRVARLWGPERIETGWWRGPMVARDYYHVETTTGRRFWLFRCRRDGRWFLHGMFE